MFSYLFFNKSFSTFYTVFTNCFTNNYLKQNFVGTHNCDENASCVKTAGVSGFTCECDLGWTDRLAADGFTLAAGLPGLTCIDVDECLDPSSCDQTNFCVNTPGSFNCGCLEGFTGTNPNDCQDINECDDAINPPCHVDADCTNSVGSFTCACKSGYFGTGFNCADENECLILEGKSFKISKKS